MISTPMTPVHGNWEVVRTRRFDHFWPFSWDIGHYFFAPGSISTTQETRYMIIGTSLELVDSVISGRFHGLMLTVFAFGDDFNDS